MVCFSSAAGSSLEKGSDELKNRGTGELFALGAPTKPIVDYVREWVGKKRG
jgi:hypothetical protein